MEVLESELLMPLSTARALLRASLASHKDVDLKKMSSHLSEISFDMMSVMPYLSKLSKGGGAGMQQEREKAVELYHAVMRQEMEKNKRSVPESPAAKDMKVVPIAEKKDARGN